MERMVQGSERVLQSLPSATHLHSSVSACGIAPHKHTYKYVPHSSTYVSATYMCQTVLHMCTTKTRKASPMHFQMNKTLSSQRMNDGEQQSYYQSIVKECTLVYFNLWWNQSQVKAAFACLVTEPTITLSSKRAVIRQADCHWREKSTKHKTGHFCHKTCFCFNS